jgi:hypothetical protein
MKEILYYNPTEEQGEEADKMVERSNGRLTYDQAYKRLGVNPISSEHEQINGTIGNERARQALLVKQALGKLALANKHNGLTTMQEVGHPRLQTIKPSTLDNAPSRSAELTDEAKKLLEEAKDSEAMRLVLGEGVSNEVDILSTIQNNLFGKENTAKRQKVYRRLGAMAGTNAKK